MSEQEGLAAIIHEHIWGAEYPTDEADCCADAVLASPWLRAHDDRIRAEALRDLADMLEAEHSDLPDVMGVARWIRANDPASLRVAAGTPTPLFGICPDCNVAGGHYPTCPARTPTHHTTEEDR